MVINRFIKIVFLAEHLITYSMLHCACEVVPLQSPFKWECVSQSACLDKKRLKKEPL